MSRYGTSSHHSGNGNKWSHSNVASGSRYPPQSSIHGRQEQVRTTGIENGCYGNLTCDADVGLQKRCEWRTSSEQAMQLHRVDRHLIYPAGGVEELHRIDPLLEEERREQARRARKRGIDDEAEDKANTLVQGLNISLDTPELIAKWIEERKKRWPTAAVVKQKYLQSWDDEALPRRRREDRFEKSKAENRQEAANISSSSSSSSSPSEIEEGDEDESGVQIPHANKPVPSVEPTAAESGEISSENSDMDEERDAVSSKIPPHTAHSQLTSPCRFFQRGHCRNGDSCAHRHDIKTNALDGQLHQEPQQQQRKRKRPRAPSPNPFEAPHLLRALLQNEIAQHVNYVCQTVRFLVRNQYLENVERHAGDADEQARKREQIVVLKSTSVQRSSSTEEQSGLKASEDVKAPPLVPGALPILGGGLYEAQSPALKPISSLALPPEPDEFALMDPLRAHDAKPLTHAQFRQLALDEGIRAALVDERERQTPSRGMIRALSTLDALPSYGHRASAVEQILGVSQQSAHHAHQLGPTYVRSDRQPTMATGNSGGGGGSGKQRLIGENELFRLGLRVGILEIQRIRQLAGRISAVIGGPEFGAEETLQWTSNGTPQGLQDSIQPWWDAETRQAMRVKQWHQEGEWRDKMRKLGLDID